jgi:hypothetical protein
MISTTVTVSPGVLLRGEKEEEEETDAECLGLEEAVSIVASSSRFLCSGKECRRFFSPRSLPLSSAAGALAATARTRLRCRISMRRVLTLAAAQWSRLCAPVL